MNRKTTMTVTLAALVLTGLLAGNVAGAGEPDPADTAPGDSGTESFAQHLRAKADRTAEGIVDQSFVSVQERTNEAIDAKVTRFLGGLFGSGAHGGYE